MPVRAVLDADVLDQRLDARSLLSKAEVTPVRLRLPRVTRDPKDDAVVVCVK